MALLQAFCFHPAVDGVLFASMENFIYCWENSSFDAMLRSHVVPWQNLKVKRFFHFCLVYFVLFTFRASAFARYKICTTAVEPCNELIIRLADGPIVAFCLIGCLSFCMHVAVEFITHLHLFLYIYNFNAFGPFAFLPARVNMHGFAWFFLEEQFIFLNGGDPDILHAWLDAYIALRFNSARLVPQCFHFLRNFTFNLYISWCNRDTV